MYMMTIDNVVLLRPPHTTKKENNDPSQFLVDRLASVDKKCSPLSLINDSSPAKYCSCSPLDPNTKTSFVFLLSL